MIRLNYFEGDLYNALVEAKANITLYDNLTKKFKANLITTEDIANDNLKEKPGSLVYLATKSHSLSHTKLWEKVETALRNNFGTHKNPGYKG